MKKQIRQICTDLNDGKITASQATEQLLDLFSVMQRSFQGTNRYAIEHLINDTYQVVDIIDGTCYKQGSKRDCEIYLNGA